MIGTIFVKTLRDAWKSTLGWGLILGLMGLMLVVMFPTVRDFEGLDSILEALPPAIKAMTGDVKDFRTLEGFMAYKFFAMGPLILAVYAVQFTTTGITGEERRGTMDLLMSVPVQRRQVIVEKFAGFVVSLFIVLLMCFLGVIVGVLVMPDVDTSLGHIFEATMNLAPIALTFGALTFLFSTALPRRISGGMAAVAAAVAFYMADIMSELSEVLKPLQVINPFYYHGTRTIFDGMNWGNVIVLLVASAVLFAAAVFTFQRRDLNV